MESTEEICTTEWRPDRPGAIECLQVVFKVVERCNINCSYCYYFNMGDTTPLERPAKVSAETARALARWIAAGVQALNIPRVSVSMHGGEPLLLGPDRFSEVCSILYENIRPVAELGMTVQTNGTILSDDWLRVFARHGVRVGVSIDGTRTEHDRFRLDHNGRSTFAATEANLRRLVAAAQGDPYWMPSTISVVDHRADYDKVYRYLRGIGVRSMTFLLPDRNGNDVQFRTGAIAGQIGDRLVEILDAWFSENDPDISVRFIDRAIAHYRIGARPGPSKQARKSVQILVARSDGTVTVDDSFIPALDWYSSSPVYDVRSSPLAVVLADPIFMQIERLMNTPPADCRSCPWVLMCGGGDLENRFVSATGFDNPSVYCESLKRFYEALCDRLVSHGYPVSEVEERFGERAIAV